MTSDITTGDALCHLEAMLAKAPTHMRERLTELRAYLEGDVDGGGENAAAVPYEDDLLKQVSVRANMFQTSDHSVEITVDLPFSVREWFDGHSHFDFHGGDEDRIQDDRMLSFYQQQEAERTRLYEVIRKAVAPIAIDCLRRMLGRDARQGKDRTLYGLRFSMWRSGGRKGPEPYPEGERQPRVFTITDGIVRERTA